MIKRHRQHRQRFMIATRTLAPAFLALGLAGIVVACGGAERHCRSVRALSFPVTPKHAYVDELPPPSGQLGVVADVQRTSFDGCELGNEVNDAEQHFLLADLARHRPAATLILGDLVFRGDSPEHWSYFDHLMVESGLDRGSVFALPGNHDYLFTGNLRGMKDRFPRLRQATHYAIDWGDLRLLLIDANRHELGERAWQRQLAWLDAELAAVESGRSRGVLLFSHQSPFTQSPWAPDDENLKRDVLPRFCRNTRHVAYISAHAHGYERWKDVAVPGCFETHTPFIVSAGGGGPRPPHRREGAPHDAVRIDTWPRGHGFTNWPRPFNYLLLTQRESLLRIEVYALGKGDAVVTLGETLDVPLPPPLPPPPAAPSADASSL